MVVSDNEEPSEHSVTAIAPTPKRLLESDSSLQRSKVKKIPQEKMCQSLTSTVKKFAKKCSGQDYPDVHWAKSLASDMKVLSAAQKISFKAKVYQLLGDSLNSTSTQ